MIRQKIGELLREAYWAAAEHVSIQPVYADVEFYSADAIQGLNETGSTYVIRVPENERVSRQIERPNHNVWVKDDVGIHGSVEGGSTKFRVTTTHVGVPRDKIQMRRWSSRPTTIWTTKSHLPITVLIHDPVELPHLQPDPLLQPVGERTGADGDAFLEVSVAQWLLAEVGDDVECSFLLMKSIRSSVSAIRWKVRSPASGKPFRRENSVVDFGFGG